MIDLEKMAKEHEKIYVFWSNIAESGINEFDSLEEAKKSFCWQDVELVIKGTEIKWWEDKDESIYTFRDGRD